MWIACVLNDGLAISRSFGTALRKTKIVKNFLTDAGFTVNDKKSVWYPSKNLLWLGINIDLGKCFY